MQRVKDFVKQCEGVWKRPRVNKGDPLTEVAKIFSPPKKKLRRSVRSTVIPEKSDTNNTITAEDFWWSRQVDEDDTDKFPCQH